MDSRNMVEEVFFRSPDKIFNFPSIEEAKKSYKNSGPYNHLIIENFFNDDIAELLSKELANNEKNFDVTYNNDAEKNKTISTGDQVPPIMSTISTKYSSPQMLRFLEQVTGNKGLIGDPYYNTDYGYYHIVGPGGILGSHVDHSHHSHLNLPHVVNIVVYLTKDWDEEDGGSLCLFDKTGKKVEKKVPCKFNTAAIFECSPKAFHGVEPIKDGIDKRRHSIYFAYYSTIGQENSLTESFPQLHSEKTNQDAKYGTYFILKFRDLLKWKNRNHLKIRIGNFIKLLTPPLLFIFRDKLRRAIK